MRLAVKGGALYGTVVLHFNRPELLAAAVASVDNQTVPPAVRVIVDNDSEAPPPRPAGWDLLLLDRNGGYAYGMNQGLLAMPTVEWVLLLTHDAILAPDCVEQLLAAAPLTNGPILLGPVVYLRGTSRVFSGGGYIRGPLWRAGHHNAVPAAALQEVSWIDGAVMLLNRRSVQTATPLDEQYFLYYEDIDLALTTRAQGGHVFVVAAAAACQAPGGTTVTVRTQNRLRLVRKHAPRHVVALNVVGMLARAAEKVFRGRPREASEIVRATALGLKMKVARISRLDAEGGWQKGRHRTS